MEANIIRIGNSKGLRLPKSVLNKYHIADKVEMVLEADQIIIRAIPAKPRNGWEDAFAKLQASGGDELLIPDVFADETPEEWN